MDDASFWIKKMFRRASHSIQLSHLRR